MRSTTIIFATTLGFLATLLLGCGGGSEAPDMSSVEGDVEAGKAVYMKKCKKCHGEDGKAQTKMGKKYEIPDMTSSEWQGKHDKAKVVKVVTDGSKKPKSKMKSFKEKLSAEEISAVADFVKTLK